MQVFRPCPSFPGYSAALCGAIRREAWISRTKLGKPWHRPAKLLQPTGPGRNYVYVNGTLLRREMVIADAWPPETQSIDAWLDAAARPSAGASREAAPMLAPHLLDQAQPGPNGGPTELARGQRREGKVGLVHDDPLGATPIASQPIIPLTEIDGGDQPGC